MQCECRLCSCQCAQRDNTSVNMVRALHSRRLQQMICCCMLPLTILCAVNFVVARPNQNQEHVEHILGQKNYPNLAFSSPISRSTWVAETTRPVRRVEDRRKHRDNGVVSRARGAHYRHHLITTPSERRFVSFSASPTNGDVIYDQHRALDFIRNNWSTGDEDGVSLFHSEAVRSSSESEMRSVSNAGEDAPNTTPVENLVPQEEMVPRAVVSASEQVKDFHCKTPRPLLIRVQDEHPEHRFQYRPLCAVLHRCQDNLQCCGNEYQTCQPRTSQNVTLMFNKIVFTPPDVKHESVAALSFVNHTECHCVPKESEKNKFERIPIVGE